MVPPGAATAAAAGTRRTPGDTDATPGLWPSTLPTRPLVRLGTDEDRVEALLAASDGLTRANAQRAIGQARKLAETRARNMGAKAAGPTPAGSMFTRQRKKLGDLMRAGPPPVGFMPSRTLGERMFYAYAVWMLAGHKKAGKSWCMVMQAADMIAAGEPVVYIDNENGWEVFVERLLSLGVDPDKADELLVYVPFPAARPTLDELRREFEAIAAELPGAFVVIDSLRSFMSVYGLNPNADVEVEQFLGPIMGAVKNLPVEDRITVGIIDHSNRKTAEGDEYAAAGSQAKAAGVDAVYFFKKEQRFSATEPGLVKVIAVDDRRGRLDFERYYRIGGQGEDRPLHFEHADANEVGTMGRARQAVSDFLADNEGERYTANAVVGNKAVTGKAEILRAALELEATHATFVHKQPNPKRKESWLYYYDHPRSMTPRILRCLLHGAGPLGTYDAAGRCRISFDAADDLGVPASLRTCTARRT